MPDGSRTSTSVSRWGRLATPSAADLIFVVLLFALACTPLSMRLLGDAGIGWHIRTGQQILATHSVPRVDSFSSTMNGKPWFAWEWLYDVAVGSLDAKLGLNAVVWFNAVVIATVFALLFRLLIVRGTDLPFALLLVLLAIAASTIHFLARPHLLSWMFTLAWFAILDSTEDASFNNQGHRNRGQLWILPLLMLIWVNVHGGFLIGFVLSGIFLVGAMWTWRRSREDRLEEALQKIAARRRSSDLTLVTVVSAFTSLVNPYGWKLYGHIYHYLSNRFLMDHIEEFRSPDFHGLAQRCFLALLLVVVAVLMVRGRAIGVSGGLTILFAMYAGIYSARNIPVSSILLAMAVGPLVSGGVGENFSQRMATIERDLRAHAWPLITTIVLLAIAANTGHVGSSAWMDAHFDPMRMPVEAVKFLESQKTNGPILSEDYWGGYLIYRLYPKSRVVVDDRHDLYGEEFFRSYLKMMHLEPGWQDFLEAHDATCVLLPRNAALASMLLVNKNWKEIYSDDAAILFVSNSGRLSATSGK